MKVNLSQAFRKNAQKARGLVLPLALFGAMFCGGMGVLAGPAFLPAFLPGLENASVGQLQLLGGVGGIPVGILGGGALGEFL